MRFILLSFLLTIATFYSYSQKYLLEEDVNQDTIIPSYGYKRKFDMLSYFGFAFITGPSTGKPISEANNSKSWQYREGLWGRMKINRWYSMGFYLEYARDEYRLKKPIIADTFNNKKTIWTKQINNNLLFGIFNRINLSGEKLFVDYGVYYAYDLWPRIVTKIQSEDGSFGTKKTKYNAPSIMNRNHYGIDARITYNTLALYGRYRITNLYKSVDYDLPKVTFGILFDIRE